jgi:predicted transcriptional regulator of viral defense system
MAKMSKYTQEERLLQAFEKRPMMRLRDIDALGIPPMVVLRLLKKNMIVSSGRGIVYLPNKITSEQQMLMEISLRVPRGVICLLSALRFHEIGAQNPYQIWLAIDHKARMPQVAKINLKVVRFSKPSLLYGVEHHNIQAIPVAITSPAKTVVDCFKFRNKIGLDIAIEALREGWQERRFSSDTLYRAAIVCRVEKVIRPYMEALV